MNKVILMGRLTRNPDIKYSTGERALCIARFSLAINRRFKREGEPDADFLNCVAFGKQGEFVEKYLKQGTKVVVSGRIQTGSYINRDGVKVYTTDIIVEEIEFAESKNASAGYGGGYQSAPYQSAAAQGTPAPQGIPEPGSAANEGFMTIPESIDDELPFI